MKSYRVPTTRQHKHRRTTVGDLRQTGQTLQVRLNEHKSYCSDLSTSKSAVELFQDINRIDCSRGKEMDNKTN